MAEFPVTTILDLWLLLADGSLQELRQLPWLYGDGFYVALDSFSGLCF